MMAPVLIVAYGNPLRSDDGVALCAADKLEATFSPSEVEILRLHQLAPEVAESVSHFALVIFIDAASRDRATAGNPGEVHLEEIDHEAVEASRTARFSHSMNPATLIAMAAGLYGAAPRAFSATITGQDFDHGEGLSPVVAAALPALVSEIEGLVRRFLGDKR